MTLNCAHPKEAINASDVQALKRPGVETTAGTCRRESEIQRVLKPGGVIALIVETYRGGPFRLLYAIVVPLLRAAFLSDADQRDPLTQAGSTEVANPHVSGENWICAAGRRPTQPFLCRGGREQYARIQRFQTPDSSDWDFNSGVLALLSR
jgi:hypothetical protein